MENKTNNNKNILFIGAIVALLGTSVYLFLGKSKTDKKLETTGQKLAEVSSAKETIQGEYNAALTRLDMIKTENQAMDSLLASKNIEIGDLKTKIEAIMSEQNISETKLTEAKSLIAAFNTKMDTYITEIQTLKTANESLKKDKTALTTANKTLEKDKNILSTEKKVLSSQKTELVKEKTALTADKTALTQKTETLTKQKDDLAKEKQKIAQEKENLETKKVELEKKVELAKVLKASNITLTPVKNRFLTHKEAETTKAKRAEQIKINFDIDDNRISESGEKMVYIVIYSPSGDAYGTTTFTMANNTEKTFTTTKVIPYVQGESVKNISLEWKPSNEKFESGEYLVEIYHMGYLIGSNHVTLK